MAVIYAAGHKGPEVRNDCWVRLDPQSSHFELESTVQATYGRQIEAEVRSALAELGLDGIGIHVVDSGAFSWCLRARVESAARGLEPARRMVIPSAGARRTSRRRTRLYLPGNTPKFFVNASLYGADALIFDLEDAVPPDEKEEARNLVRHALASVDLGAAERMVRINRGAHQRDDLAMAKEAGVDTVLVPKVESSAELEALAGDWSLIPLLESAKGIENAFEIAAAPGVSALAIGVQDYLAELEAGREALNYAYSRVVNAARAHGISPLASIWSDIDDLAGLEDEARRLAGLGFDGMGCLHPGQVAPIVRAWTPTEAELAEARAIVEAFDLAQGVVSVNHKMVDLPVAERARKVLARAETGLPEWRIG